MTANQKQRNSRTSANARPSAQDKADAAAMQQERVYNEVNRAIDSAAAQEVKSQSLVVGAAFAILTTEFGATFHGSITRYCAGTDEFAASKGDKAKEQVTNLFDRFLDHSPLYQARSLEWKGYVDSKKHKRPEARLIKDQLTAMRQQLRRVFQAVAGGIVEAARIKVPLAKWEHVAKRGILVAMDEDKVQHQYTASMLQACAPSVEKGADDTPANAAAKAPLVDIIAAFIGKVPSAEQFDQLTKENKLAVVELFDHIARVMANADVDELREDAKELRDEKKEGAASA